MSNQETEKTGTVPTSVRITPTCEKLWSTIAEGMGLSKAKALEVIIREKAKAEGIEIPSKSA
jgi:hypothetical protein